MSSNDLTTASSSDPTASFSAPSSIFALLRDELGQAGPIVRCTKATLIHLSHTLEDLVLSRSLPALLLTGFQEASHRRAESERYRALTEVAQRVCIFAGGELPPESGEREIYVPLVGDNPLRQEWFLVILAPSFCVVLCGHDLQVAVEDEMLRNFDTIWSFEPALVELVVDRLETVVAALRPERLELLREARRKVPPPQPDAQLMTTFAAEIIRFEEQLQHSLYATSRALREQLYWREQLTEMLVHDLRTPLQSVIMSLNLLRSTPNIDQETMQTTIGLAMRGTTTITSMVSLILDTNRLENHQFHIQWQQYNLGEIIEDVVATLRSQIDLKQIVLVVVLPTDLPRCWGDRELLARVLQNLLDNACKFTHSGGTITVEARMSAQQDTIELLVSDTGVGIDPAALPHIFERHFQATRNDRRGMGIGLYFCRLALESQGGRINATPKVGGGTVFTIMLLTKLPNSMYQGA